MSINSVTFVGRLVSDPELRFLNTGTAVCSFTLALNDGYGDNQKTYYIDHVAFKKRAETIAEFCKKGSLVGTKGRLTTRTYKNKEDRTVKVTEVVVEDIQFLTPTNTQGNGQNANTGHSDPFENDSKTVDLSFDDLPF